MIDWELISDDPSRRIKKYIGIDPSSDEILIKTQTNDTAIIDRNRERQNEDFDRRKDIWHVASIPTSVMYEWLARHGVNAWDPTHADAVKKLLNSSDYRWCKIKHIIL